MDRLVRTPPGPSRILRPIVFESLEGNGYHPSYEFNVSLSAERLTSSWNLVEIDGEWKIIDTQVSYGTLSIFHHFFSQWGSRVVSSNSNDDVDYNYEEFYFCPDADDFIRYFSK